MGKWALALLIVAVGTPATAEFRPIETSIAFVHTGGIRNWQADDSDTLYIQDRSNAWHRAELMGTCPGLPFAETIGFETRGGDRFDKFGNILVRGRMCAVKSLVASGPPLPKRERKLIKG